MASASIASRKRDEKFENKRESVRVCFDRLVDSIQINYATWANLSLYKNVGVGKYEHLRLMPKS
jgi:hypothetical protein